MKKFYAGLVFSIVMASGANAQIQDISTIQMDTVSNAPLIPLEKQGLLGRTSLTVSSRIGGNAYFVDKGFEQYKWTVDRFMFDLKSQINDRVGFRFRYRQSSFHNDFDLPRPIDNMSRAVDLAFVDIKMNKSNDAWKVALGKIYLDWGGFEFDYNPIYIFRYSDFQNNAECFMTGLTSWHQIDETSSFTLQVLNNTVNPTTLTIEDQQEAGLVVSKASMAYLVNYRKNFWDDKIMTSTSYTMVNQAKGYYNNFIVTGLSYKITPKLKFEFDYNFAYEQIDRSGVLTGYMQFPTNGLEDGPTHLSSQGALFQTYWTKIDYNIYKDFSVFFIGWMVDTKYNGARGEKLNQKYYKSYCYNPGIKYINPKLAGVQVYATYIGQNVNFTSYAKENYGNNDYNTGQVSFGIIAPLRLL
jgi:hypothetical protein